MRLSKPVKLVVGAVTLWPFFYALLFFCFVFLSMFWMHDLMGEGAGAGPPVAFLILMAGHFLTMGLMLALVVFYIVYLFKTDRVAEDKKALWAVVLFLGNVLAMPVFFYLYIWPEDAPQHPGTNASG